jgi:polyphosphate glucokinase
MAVEEEPRGDVLARTAGMTGVALGIDIGGTGMKAAPVDLATGSLLHKRYRLLTPQPAKPKAVAEACRELVSHFAWQGPIGVTFPAVVKRGVVRTAANVDARWIGTDADGLLTETTGCPVAVLNDADAAGIAEMRFGAGTGRSGTTIMVTLGTGIGTALFVDSVLVPNTEFGHIELRGRDAEERAAANVRETQDLSWKAWAEHVDDYLAAIEALLSPDLIIIGGGVSEDSDKWFKYLVREAEVVPAALGNNAGIVGAALFAPVTVTAPT